MAKINTIVNELCDFIVYVDSFYNEKKGLYPIKGLTNTMILKATQRYIALLNKDKSYTWGGGDSLDRERVRDIILTDNKGLQQ